MAWIEQRRRADGGVTARVFWRPGGCRDTPRDWETFSAGSDAQNLARADGFKRMVEAAGQRWPDGWVKAPSGPGVCASCATECEAHADMHEHCRICAEACRRCEQACADLLGSLG